MKRKEVLQRLAAGEIDVDQADELLRVVRAPWARVDNGRLARTGIPEVVYGEGKEAAQIIAIARRMLDLPQVFVATRVGEEKARKVMAAIPELGYHPEARMLVGNRQRIVPCPGKGGVAVLAAGTSDLPVAEEAALSAECLGLGVARLYDVGVAGLHRLLEERQALEEARVVIAVAGMEGALATVVAGLVRAPVIAVPTSVGYGAAFGGVAALLAMLNSCAPGVAVVNIDNGFGAACMAAAIMVDGRVQ